MKLAEFRSRSELYAINDFKYWYDEDIWTGLYNPNNVDCDDDECDGLFK